MRIADITLAEVLNGRNWRVTEPEPKPSDTASLDDFERWEKAYWQWKQRMDRWEIEAADAHNLQDRIVYSGVVVSRDGAVSPILLIRSIEELDFGGDYLQLVSGEWRPLGEAPKPDAPPVEEYIANPLRADRSFADVEYRQWHRTNFRQWAARLRGA